ncbi:hypothetical protein GW17_00039389 [Ensete ventricosum]|nr:hypothetical protein GW17_00039389 [Ensete ventricosum]
MAEDRRPRAIFMAFGTRGDVFPIAAIAAAFACDQQQYHVVLITHLAHQSLSEHLAAKNVAYIPVPSPPVLSVHQFGTDLFFLPLQGSEQIPFSMHKKRIQVEHRQQCLSVVERVLGDYPSMKDDFIVINFFALVPLVNWKDVVHWMWPLFTEDWGRWRSENLKLSPIPFMVRIQQGNCGVPRFILFSSGYEPLDAAIQSIACESSNRANPPPSNRHGTLLFIRYLIAGYSLNVQLQFITEAGKDLNVVFDLFIRFLGIIFSVPSYWISSIGQRGFTGWELHQSRYEVGICFQTTTMPLASARLQIASQGP